MISAQGSHKTVIRVMIVEDHMVYRMGLKLIIEADPNLKVVGEATDGHSAIELAQELKPDVIVMDLSMPILDGIESTRQIKMINPDCKVLMLTSRDGDEQVFSSLSAGADGYCLKDISAELLTYAIHAIYSGVCWLDPAIAKRVVKPQPAPNIASIKKINPATSTKFDLSDRQMEILELVVKGMSNLQMADYLSVSHDTVKTHMRNIMEKLAVADRTQVAVKAIRDGLVSLEHI